jgi:hypothetical protein
VFFGDSTAVLSVSHANVAGIECAYPGAYGGDGIYVDNSDYATLASLRFAGSTTGQDVRVTGNANGTLLINYAQSAASKLTDGGVQTTIIGPHHGFSGGPTLKTRIVQSRRTGLTYGTTIVVDTSKGDFFTLTVTDGVAFTISNPTLGVDTEEIAILIANGSGGAMGAVTFGANYKLAGAFVAPANGNRRMYKFRYDGANWYESHRSPADIV